MLYFTVSKLGFTEAEFWKFTLKKYITLHDIYDEENTPSEEREVFADNIL